MLDVGASVDIFSTPHSVNTALTLSRILCEHIHYVQDTSQYCGFHYTYDCYEMEASNSSIMDFLTNPKELPVKTDEECSKNEAQGISNEEKEFLQYLGFEVDSHANPLNYDDADSGITAGL